ncbi:MAG: RNA polymerase sigma factor RpoD/SigA [Spirochaetaceae bacterium]|jgi:RNA polymerase primary sigma factor|nr:RNA polymerase sigma factor RpoD/SigA [Spirochaetaceae bacterium]
MSVNYKEQALGPYLNEINRIPRENQEEVLSLAQRIQKGDSEAKEKLIRANLRLVVAIARQFPVSDIPFMDLVQEGNLGLIRAVEKYDPLKNTKFATYASLWIRQSISRFLASKRRNIRLPLRKEKKFNAILQACHILNQKLQRPPTLREIAQECRLKESEIALILQAASNPISLENDNSQEAAVIDIYEDLTYNPEREFFHKYAQDNTLGILNRLKARERWIIMHRYQIGGCEHHTLRAIGEKLNLSPECVRQMEKKALKKIKNYTEAFEAM